MPEPTPELEAAARALALIWALGDVHSSETPEEYADQHWHDFVYEARAAIAAVLLEPSPGMCNAVAPWLHKIFAEGAIRDLGQHILGESE